MPLMGYCYPNLLAEDWSFAEPICTDPTAVMHGAYTLRLSQLLVRHTRLPVLV